MDGWMDGWMGTNGGVDGGRRRQEPKDALMQGG